MKVPMLFCVAAFIMPLVSSPAAGQSGKSALSPSGVGQVVGTWQLVQIETRRRDNGELIDSLSGNRVAGLLMYDSGGYMSVQLKREWNPNIPYLAYFGTFSVDEKAGTVTHHVKMSTNSYKGTDQVRAYHLEDGGKRLILTPVNAPDVAADVLMQLTWQRVH
jgi:hypothetical protein